MVKRLKRRRMIEALTGIGLGLVAVIAITATTAGFLPHQQKYSSIPSVNAIGIPADSYPAGENTTSASRVPSIPVISWHQMDNGCRAAAPLCADPDFSETNVTQWQFYDELSWLHSHGYRTITAAQYVKWATGQAVTLPAKPVLLTVDDGIANFYAGATPALRHFGYTMVSMVVSGFAQGAEDGARQYQGWDATWTQLRNLPADVWEFAFHAGPRGHGTTDAGCPYYYPCQRSGESAAAYRARVASDIDAGIAAEQRNLGDRADTRMWAVPFNDLAQDSTQPRSGTTPAKWLNDYAAKRFAVAFVDGKGTRDNQHYRYEVHGTDSLAFFAGQVQRSDVYTRYPSPATATVRAGGPS